MNKVKSNTKFWGAIIVSILIVFCLLLSNKNYGNVSGTIIGSPTNFIASSNKDGSICLSWNVVANANGYEVWQSTDNQNWKRVQIITNANNTSYSKLKTNIAYYYKVSAWTGTKSKRTNGEFTNVLSMFAKSGNSASAIEKTNIIPSTVSLSGVAVNETTITLNYSIAGSEVVGILVYQKDQNGNWVEIQNNKDLTNTTLNIPNLVAGNIYSFKSVVYKIDGASNIVGLCESNVVDIQLPTTQTTQPVTQTPAQIAPKTEDTTATTTEVPGGTFVTDIYNGTNALRTSLGLNTLTVDPLLVSIAQIRANDMATNQYFSHYKDNSLQLSVVGMQVGLGSSISSGENIARTTATANVGNRFVGMWTASSGHYANMIDGMWTKIGVAMAQDSRGRWYGVQIFSN